MKLKINKKTLSIMIVLLVFVFTSCNQETDKQNKTQDSNQSNQNEKEKENSDDTNSNQSNEENSQNPSDKLDELEKKEYFVEEDKSVEKSKDKIIIFAQNFINLYTGSIGKAEEVSFENYISNENLLKYVNEVVKLETIKNLEGNNAVNYDLDNEFNEIEFKPINENLSYLKIMFSNNGSGMVSQMLIKKTGKNISIVDVYSGNKDGADMRATGHHTERKVDNPDLWDDEAWVKKVFEKLEKYEDELIKTSETSEEN